MAASTHPSPADLSPPPYTILASSHEPYVPLPTLVEDEECSYGFWGETTDHEEKLLYIPRPHATNEPSYLYDLICFVSAVVVCILACFGVIFLLSVTSSHIKIPAGLDLSWMGGRYGHLNEMRFCLDTPDRQAPGPQVWRHMGRAGQKCGNEVVTLLVGEKEAWKVRADDEFLVEDAKDRFVQFSRVYRD